MSDIKKVLLIFKSGAKTTVDMTDDEIKSLKTAGDEVYQTPVLAIVRAEVAFMEILK